MLNHEHTFEAKWTSDDTYHWHASTCGHETEISGKAEHNWDNGVVAKAASETETGVRTYTCVICSATKTEEIPTLAHIHTYEEGWTSDDAYHWHASICGHETEISGKAEHNWDAGIVVESLSNDDGITIRYTCLDCTMTKEEVVPNESYSVTFIDYDGTVLSSQWVLPSDSADAPIQPFREGYRFVEWDKSFNNVQSNLEVFAVYVKICTVAFIDFDGSFLSVEEIDYGSNITSPKINPKRINYVFDGWYLDNIKLNNDFSRTVFSDLVIEARYIRQYTVKFVDFDGTIIETRLVNSGTNTYYPTHPTRTGYSFKPGADGWDKTNLNIQEDTIITALYEINYYDVRFLSPDNKELKVDRVAYDHYALAPTDISEVFFTWNKNIAGYENNTAYIDPEWDKSIDINHITDNTDVKLIYKTKITDTVLAMKDSFINDKDIQDGKKANVTFFIYSSSETICGLNIEISYQMVNSQGEQVNYISLDDTFTDEIKRDDYISIKPQSGYNKKYSEKIDTNSKLIQFVWSSDGIGNSLNNGNNAIITISFSVEPNTPVGEYEIQIMGSSFFVDGNLKKIQPVIISGKIIVEE